jgi:hypothetical protein
MHPLNSLAVASKSARTRNANGQPPDEKCCPRANIKGLDPMIPATLDAATTADKILHQAELLYRSLRPMAKAKADLSAILKAKERFEVLEAWQHSAGAPAIRAAAERDLAKGVANG